MRYPTRILAVATTAVLMLVSGCQSPQPVPRRVQVSLSEEQGYQHLWDHAVRSVRHFGYEMDRVDSSAGVIISKPLLSKQWFEFWRNDTLEAGQVLEASLHTIRRQVRLDVQPIGHDSKCYSVAARVDVQRLSQLERQITTTSAGAQAMTEKLPPIRQPGLPDQAESHWVDLGRDKTLEAAVLRRISRYPGAEVITTTDDADVPTMQPSETETPAPTSQPTP